LEVCELSDWIPENALKAATQTTAATFLEWEKSPETLKVEVPTPSMSTLPQVEFEKTIGAESQRKAVLCEMNGLSKEVVASLLEYNETNQDDDVAKIDLVGRSGTRNAKRLSIIAAPSLLKSAAEDKLPLKFNNWYKLRHSPEFKFGRCEIDVPPRPREKWQKKSSRDDAMERVYDAEESNEYYRVSLRDTVLDAGFTRENANSLLV
jgi:hypothetical protein